jgi:hypothetical protein
MAQCRNNPGFCGISLSNCPASTNKVVHGFFSLSEGSLYLPAIDVPNIFNSTVITYQVQMKLIAGREPLSFAITSAVPVE